MSFLLFGAPLLRALQGESSPLPRREALPIRGGYEKRTTRTELLRARLHAGPEGRTEAHLASSQSSGAVTSFATADAIVVLAPETTEVRDGQAHPVIRIADVLG